MIEVMTALGWRRTIKYAQNGEATAQELIEYADAMPDDSPWKSMTKRALTAMALVLTEDGWEKLGDRSPLGKPTGKAAQREDGAYVRNFEKGMAIFVPGFSNNVLIQFNDRKVVVSSPGGDMLT
jgi:hypothetical protein